MSLRLFTGAPRCALVPMASNPLRRRASTVGGVGLSRRVCSSCPIMLNGPAASLFGVHAAPLTVSRRAQSSLQKLLDDPSDPYLAALQQFDIPRIADIVAAGPATSGVPATFLRRVGIRIDADGMSATEAQVGASTLLAQRRAQSSGEAVLQSLHATGVQCRSQAEAVAKEKLRSAQEAYDSLPQEEKGALQTELVVSHLFDGLCAMSAALRVQAEEGTPSVEELDAAFSVYERIIAYYREGLIAEDRWSTDFVPELEELRVIWRHLGDDRPMPLEK
ncbi:hypothetical protein JKF63_05441 [Porcisia hertigi]|uniref:Uncharacterized protein n=1 Tax=Porcisia hertigi TaxID=2761500 RepID=A0A836IBF4_9TRYP|nr:hypothetical protein JKF63_05441 [Porcisia hertigi]